MVETNLFTRWLDLCQRLDAKRNLVKPYGVIVEAYNEPHRKYHTIKHLVDCLDEIDELPESKARKRVELALWFHDMVYEPLANDNEEKSALFAVRFARECWLPDIYQIWMHKLILATKHDREPESEEEKLIVDVDLAIFGKEPPVFDEYESKIREEYSSVPDDAFRKGRAAILRRFLGRKYIYSTAHFREKYEVGARYNLERSLKELTQT